MRIFYKRSKEEKLEPADSSGPEVDAILKTLCGDDEELYCVMSNFLLLDPKHQEKMLSSAFQLIEEGKKALEKSNNLSARVNFETAAKFELYHQDRLGVEKALKLAGQAAEQDEARQRMYKILIPNLEKALDVSSQYYMHMYPVSTDLTEKESKTLEIPAIPLTK